LTSHNSYKFLNLLAKHPFMVGTKPQLIVVSGLLVGIPFTLGFRPQLVVVSGLFGGIPSAVGFRPQLVVVLGLFCGNPFDGVILGFHGAFVYHEAFSQTFPIS
jgi:predicted membrane protein